MTFWLVTLVGKDGCTDHTWPKFIVMMLGSMPSTDAGWPAFFEIIYDKVRKSQDYHPNETIPEHTLDAELFEFGRDGCSLAL